MNMPKIRGALSGFHPLGEELIQAILDFKYGRAGKDIVKGLFQKELTALIRLQEDLKEFPVLSTGSFGIEDLIRPFTRSLPALHSYEELGDLPINRIHFTNTFYRQPAIKEELPNTASVLISDVHSLSDENSYSHDFLSGKRGRIIIPGPVSFASLISKESNPYSKMEDLIEASGDYLAAELLTLPEQYVEIQYDEPSLVWERIPRTLRPAITSAYDKLSRVTDGKKTIISTYFESCENILSFLLDLPVSGVGVDFTKTNILSISDYSFAGKILQAGIVDAQNYIPNEEGELDNSINQLLANYVSGLNELNPDEIVVTPTTGLEYLPREIADQKLRQIADIVNIVKGGSS